MECKNSSGYFKDPITFEDLSPDTPRVVKCSFVDGKFTWPCVLSSDGEQPLKIVYKYFTNEEKDLYKAYRGRSVNSPSASKPISRPKEKIINKEIKNEQLEVVKYNKDSATSLDTLDTLVTLAKCDNIIGISNIGGISYALCGAINSNKVYHIPRTCIPDEEFERLCNG